MEGVDWRCFTAALWDPTSEVEVRSQNRSHKFWLVAKYRPRPQIRSEERSRRVLTQPAAVCRNQQIKLCNSPCNISDNEWVVNNRLATTQQVVKWLMSNRVGGGPLGRALQQILIDIISTADRGWWPSVPAAALNRTQCSLVASNYFTKHWQHVYWYHQLYLKLCIVKIV